MTTPLKLSEPVPADDAAAPATPADEILVERARAGDLAAFELLMRRHNRRVYRTIRSVLREGAEIEDAMQDAYLAAFTHLEQFEGASRWSTWLCRIAFNEALARVRRERRFVSIDDLHEATMNDLSKPRTVDPERAAGSRELAGVLEAAIDGLPDIYRSILMLRQIEGLSVAETAAVLDVAEEVVKTRLHRARALVRAGLEARIGDELPATFGFGAERCDRVVASVLARLPRSL